MEQQRHLVVPLHPAPAEATVQRIRASLKTKCVFQARERRNRIFADLNGHGDAGPARQLEPRTRLGANLDEPVAA